MSCHRPNATRRAVVVLVGSSVLVAGCGDDPEGVTGPPCADPATALAMPHPAWQRSGSRLSAPPGDRAAELFATVRPGWAEQLGGVDGWPRRPTVLVPLSGAAAVADVGAIRLYAGEPLADQGVELDAWVDDASHTLVVQPLEPIRLASREVVLVVGQNALEEATALPVCGADGIPAPEYAAALERLPAEASAALALPFTLATTTAELPALYDALQSDPALEVESIEARTLDSFGEHAPPSEVAASLAPTAAHGILSLPAYQDADGIIQVGSDQVPIAAGTTEPGFVVALPAAGTPPFPFVLYQHGGSQQKENILPIAGPLADAGFALVAVDLPFHGDRAAPGGGGDLDILNFDDPLATRDNLRQASADHLAVLTGVAALNAALEPLMGQAEILDATRPHYMGLSLGAVTGTFTFTAARSLEAAALFVGGGGYPEIVKTGLFSIYVTDLLAYEGAERAALLGLVEALLDGADPLAYAAIEDQDAPPRPALFCEAVDDPVIGNAATDQWARAFGAALAEPEDHAVEAMPTLPLPITDNATWPGDGQSATRVLIQAPMAEIDVVKRHGDLIRQPYSQELVAHCFATLAADGSCEALDTGFADH